jgi:integrase
MLSAGEIPVWIAGQMGHSDLYAVFRVYGKWIKDADPQAGLKSVEMSNKNAGKKLAFHSRNDAKAGK